MSYQLYRLLVSNLFKQLLLVYGLNKNNRKVFLLAAIIVVCFKPTLLVSMSQAQTHHLNSFLLLQTNQSSPNAHDFPLWWEVQATFRIFRVLQRWNNVWMLLFSKPCRAGAGPSMEMWMRILKISKICSAKGKLKMFRCQEKCLGGICFCF